MGLKPMFLGESRHFFGLPAVILFAVTHFGIPFLQFKTGLPILICWFLAGGFGVFAPLLVASLLFYSLEAGPSGFEPFLERFRLERSLSVTCCGHLAA
jgi:hypothetical protein